MKYFAILRDSLREAIDAKIFYVLIGLSALLTLVAFSLTFNPQSGGDFWDKATIPLNVDLSKLNPENLDAFAMHGQRGGSLRYFEFVSAKPINGAAEGPGSRYHVLVRERLKKMGNKEPPPRASFDETAKEIQQKFGNFGGVQIVNATRVEKPSADNPDMPKDPPAEDVYYEITTEPTSASVHWWPHEIGICFGALPLGTAPLGIQLYIILGIVVGGIGAWITVLISVIITGFFIPNMLRKGSIDLLIVKPVHRPALLIYKYLGGLLFIVINTSVAVFGMWLALGTKSGLWANNFLLTIFAVSFFFAILYSVSTLFAVLTRSVVASILITCGVWFGLFVVGQIHHTFEHRRQMEASTNIPEEARWGDNTFGKVASAVHFVLPRTQDLNQLMNRMLVNDLLTGNQLERANADQTTITWGESLSVSFGFIAVMLGMSCWFFSRKDF